MWDWALISIAIITSVVVWLRWTYGHWRKKGIPYLEPTIVFGNVREAIIGNINLGTMSQRIYNAFPDEPAVGFFRMRTPILQIKDLDLIKAVLITEFNSFRNNGLHVSKEADPILGRNPFFLRDEEWKETRRIQTHNHTASKLKVLYGYVEEVKDELISHVNENLGKKYDAGDFCARFTTDVVSSCVFGIKTNSLSGDSEFRQKSLSIFDLGWRMQLWQMIPSAINWFRIPILHKVNKDYFQDLVKSVVESRQKNNLSRADFLQNLINEKTEKLSLVDMTAQTMTFFIDGYGTSATEMAFTMFMLAIHPEVQHRLRDEVNSAEKLDFDTLHHLPYMDAVVNEALRIYPAGTHLNRRCNQDITITVKNRKYEFKKGDNLEIPVYAIHRDSRHFPDALKFDPERFLRDPNNPAHLTFGAGPRACFGSRFAKTLMKAGIAALVQNFIIYPGTDDHSMPTVTNNKSLLISPDKEMSVKFEKLLY